MALAGLLFAGSTSGRLLADAKADRNALEATLTRALVGQTASAKIVFAHFEPHELLDQPVLRPLCTDVDANGRVSYVLTWSVLGPKQVLHVTELQSYASPGAVLRVDRVNVRKDRFELDLRELKTDKYSRLRYWGAKDFASRADPLELLGLLAPHLEFDGVLGDLVAQPEASWRFAEREQEAQRSFQSAPVESPERLTTGITYITLLESEIGRRQAWADVAGVPADIAELEASRDSFEQQIARLAEQINGPRLSEIRIELDQVANELAAISRSVAEGMGSELLFDRWGDSIDRWRGLIGEYTALRGPGSIARREALEQSAVDLRDARRSFHLQNEEEAALTARSIQEEFEQGVATTVAGLRRQQSRLVEYRALLAERRELIARLSPPAPGAIRARLESDEARASGFAQQIAEGQPALRPQLLEAEYRDLEARRRKLYNDYTLAFGGPRHNEAARALIEHIEVMIRNRREAASLGSSRASSQIEELEQSRRKTQSQMP